MVGVGAAAAIDVTVAVNPGGMADCNVTITVDGTAATAACTAGAPVQINVPDYNTPYTATVTATNGAGTSAPFTSQAGNSSLKALDANASTAFGAGCPNAYGGDGNCGPSSGTCSSADPTANPAGGLNGCANNIAANTTVYATCWETGLAVSGVNPPAYPDTAYYNQWIDIDNPAEGYMSELWFPDPPAVINGLPGC
jgi:hypothetical protein